MEKDPRQRKILKTFRNFHKNHIFDTSDFTTAVRKSLWTPCPLFAREHFGAQNAFWDPKFISGPKMHFGTKMLPGEKGPKWNRLFRTAVVKTDVS